jgi:hypothetical protein
MFMLTALDELEKRYWHDIWRTAVADAVADLRIDLARFGPVQAMIVPGEPTEPSLNLVLGAAAPGAVDGRHLEDSLAWATVHGVDYRVPVTPGGPDAQRAERWLSERGHEQGASRAMLIRDASSPTPPPPREVEAIALDRSSIDEGFAEAFAEGFEMPFWATTFFFELPGTEDWRCYLAAAGDAPLAYAAMLTYGGVAALALAQPTPCRRAPDGHAALLERCIEDAAAANCEAIVAEIEQPRAGRRPTTAGESLLLAGFEQAFVRADWRPPRHAVAKRNLHQRWL